MLFLALAAAVLAPLAAQNSLPTTYCNPVNIDYGFASIPGAIENGKHRATADPAIVVFRGEYYLFSTNQAGYWWSSDMSSLDFRSPQVPQAGE